MYTYTLLTLPNNLPELRTGTAGDGRMLISAPVGRQKSILRDIRSRLPLGWSASVYEPSGVDVVITHTGR